MCRVFFCLGWDLALYCTYVPRVCRVIPCPMLLVRTSYHTVFSGVNHVSREHSTAAVGFHFGVPRTILSSRTTRPHSKNESSSFFSMYQKRHHQQQACTLLYRLHVHVSCFFWGGWDLALYCTYVPRVCRIVPCPILLVRTSYHTVFSCFSCDNNSVFITLHSEQHELLWWDVSKK